MSGYTPLGTPCILPSQPVYRAPLRQSVVRPGAQRGCPGLWPVINILDEAHRALLAPKVWQFLDSSAQSCSCSPCTKGERSDSDRVTLGYFPMCRQCCAEWSVPSGHPIVADLGAKSAPCHHPFHCWLIFIPGYGPGAGLSSLLDVRDHAAQTARRCCSAHVSETGISARNNPGKDTGGERWVSNPGPNQEETSHSGQE